MKAATKIACAGCATTQTQYAQRKGKAVKSLSNKISKKIGLLLKPSVEVQAQLDKLRARGFDLGRLCAACYARNKRAAAKSDVGVEGGGYSSAHMARVVCMQPGPLSGSKE